MANTDFTPIHNPYIVGNPIKGSKMFFGRLDDFNYIKAKFSGAETGGLVVLCGARRSGKTSVLFQIMDGRLGENFVPVLVDMQSMTIANETDFLVKLTQCITGAGLTSETDFDISIAQAENPFEEFEKFIRRTNEALGDKHIVLAIDEYELIETNIDSGVLSMKVLTMLINLIERHHIFILFTGGDNLEERNQEYWGMFMSKAVSHRRISFLSYNDTLRLINDPVDGLVEYEEGVQEKIAALTAGQPFYTQVICQNIVDHLNEMRDTNVAEEDVDEVVEEVIENPLPQMIFHWNALSELERVSLSIIAELNKTELRPITAAEIAQFAEDEKIGYRLDINAVNKTLEKLFHGDLISKSADEDSYEFRMGLWRQWATRMHSVWAVIREIEQEGGPAPDSGLIPVKQGITRGRVAVFASVLVAVASVLYFGVFNQGSGTLSAVPVDSASITVDVSPPDAIASYNGVVLAGGLNRIAAGRGELTVVLPGYRPYRDSVDVEKDAELVIPVALEAKTGSLSVSSTPPGAAIQLDGEATGEVTPFTIADLPANQRHEVTLSLAGYNPQVFPAVEVFADSVVSLAHSFSKRRQNVTVESVPVGALVFVDGRQQDEVTPVIVTLSFGMHELRVSKEGYHDHEEQVTVPVAGGRVQARLEQMPPGMLKVVTIPDGEVEVDGKVVSSGKMHHDIELAVGRYSVTLRRAGATFTQQVTVASKETTELRHDFRKD